MIKDALSYLVSLKENKTYDINGETYSDHDLHRIKPYIDRPDRLSVNGLDSIVQLIKHEISLEKNLPVFVRVMGPRKVSVFSSLDTHMERDNLYYAECDAPDFNGGWRTQEQAIIELRAAFIPNEGVDYILDLISRISVEDGVTSDDNGVTQTVTAKQGVSLKQFVNTKARVPLRPYRTFTEVEQPESEFILRLNKDLQIGLFEADGGAWKLAAKSNIKDYFSAALSAEIADGNVVVMM